MIKVERGRLSKSETPRGSDLEVSLACYYRLFVSYFFNFFFSLRLIAHRTLPCRDLRRNPRLGRSPSVHRGRCRRMGPPPPIVLPTTKSFFRPSTSQQTAGCSAAAAEDYWCYAVFHRIRLPRTCAWPRRPGRRSTGRTTQWARRTGPVPSPWRPKRPCRYGVFQYRCVIFYV